MYVDVDLILMLALVILTKPWTMNDARNLSKPLLRTEFLFVSGLWV